MTAVLSAAALLTACQADFKEPEMTETEAAESKETEALPGIGSLPQIRVSWAEEKETIPSAAGSISWNVKDEEDWNGQEIAASGQDPFAYLAKEKSQWPYLPVESWITIEFLNTPAPDSIVLSDSILNEDGRPEYSEETTKTRDLFADEQKAGFRLDTNFWAMLSTERKVYQKGGVVRGFKLDCSWADGSRADYGFIVRTDVACGVQDRSAEVYPMSMCGTGIPVFAGIDQIDVDEKGLILTITLVNQTDQEYTFGEEPKLYRYYGPEAREVSIIPGTGWNDLAHRLKPNGEASFTVDLGVVYGSLEPGYYVFYKELTRRGTKETENAAVNFTVAE